MCFNDSVLKIEALQETPSNRVGPNSALILALRRAFKASFVSRGGRNFLTYHFIVMSGYYLL